MTIVSLIANTENNSIPIYKLCGRHRGQLGIPKSVKVSTFLRKYPNLFNEFSVNDSGGTLVPWFRLSLEAVKLNNEANEVFRENGSEFCDRVCKLLMMCKGMVLPLETLDQLKWDLGLPYDYVQCFVERFKDVFELVRVGEDRVGLKLRFWRDELAVAKIEINAVEEGRGEDVVDGRLGFSVGFPRGFGLKRKSIEWLEEWQRLEYTSPYKDSSHLDSRTDVSEKRAVGVFHELLHLMVEKKTERKHVSNLRKPLNLPQKFTKVFERHPGIFYISKKNNTQTVVLREAYDGHRLVEKHPISEIRDKFACLMKEGFLDRSRGLYKKRTAVNSGEKDELHNISGDESCENGVESEEEMEGHMFSEYESDDTANLYRLFDSRVRDLAPGEAGDGPGHQFSLWGRNKKPDFLKWKGYIDCVKDSGGTLVPWFRLGLEAVKLIKEANAVFRESGSDFCDRVCKLLMTSKGMVLPLEQLKWGLGLPYDYVPYDYVQ
ncbi:protein WHAT'S THIS FACTOR 9, mitochondrial [Tanacetum coccineum]